MPSIQLQSLSLQTPDGRDLLQNLDLSFGAERTGIVGRNGTGKTTLLRVIAGELVPKAGGIAVDGRLGLLRQAVRADDANVAEALGVTGALACLARIDAGAGIPDDFEAADWTLAARIGEALAQTGLPPLDLGRGVDTLSGGQRTRLSLAALLLEQPDILLLDEPTNNLDADGRAAVAELLRTWTGGALVVSHDRALLREVDRILELTSVGARLYGGNWDAYRERQALDLAAAEHDLAIAGRQLAEIDRKAQERSERKARADSRGKARGARGDLPRIVAGARKRAAETTSGTQSRLAGRQHAEATSALADAGARIEILQPLTVTLESTRLPPGRIVLQIENLTGGPGDKPIIRTLSLSIAGPERIALTGPNGAGKTTLLRLATGALAPLSGSVRVTPRHALLDQQMALLDPAKTLRANYLRLNPGDSENACRAALARFMFRADAALRHVGELSGGEMLRAGLAVTIGATRPPELLILDEPTNHLDIHAIAAVESGLSAYDGALLVVSHDREFLDAIGVTREVGLR
ncbi:MAG: ABC transporter [Devosia sp. 67-54]|uniref:ABC-F family ATP-binding cassette domain-containing protein n=1 Tax=unclassified Devosia TaxID=196773 RepID=UPI0009663189|nr:MULTISPECIES: ABC-F family ATP-binding cassette domain-containing protein [unclassified Devosia]MBN9303993.1 ABC-F family ATP-binding cassette domain-containing protein [Devosia sp.]OJX17837.1 MAG: ABC transporter [Devosia sp. 67-54]